MNPQKRKKVSNIKQKLALLSSHRLSLRILPSRRQLSSRRLQRLSSRQMLNKNSQGLCRVQLNSFCRRHIRIIRKAYTWISKEQAKSLILLNIPCFWHLCHFSGMSTRKAIDILLSGAYVTRFWMQKPTKEPIYSRFLSLMTLFGNKILFFPINSVPLHSRKLTLMTLFGNDYDYKKRLLFTATHIEQV